MFRLVVLLICLTIFMHKAFTQTLGGNAVFNFINQSNTPQLSALGGVNISTISNDVGLSFHNPALLRKPMHRSVSASFNSFLGGIKNYSLASAYHVERYNTTVGLGINFFDYGNIAQTDASGNVMGTFHPRDYLVQLMVSKPYKEHWFLGVTAKFISSGYGPYSSNGVAADVGLNYFDSSNGIQAGLLVKNIGTQLKTYDGLNTKTELPFDVQVGITKRLRNAPIQFSLTAHHLQAFNIYYNDTSFLQNEGGNTTDRKFTGEKILSHLVFATQVYIRDKIEVTAGYNFMRRQDLNVLNATNGLNGFTAGVGLLLQQLQIRYATGFYQQNMFNQLGVNFSL